MNNSDLCIPEIYHWSLLGLNIRCSLSIVSYLFIQFHIFKILFCLLWLPIQYFTAAHLDTGILAGVVLADAIWSRGRFHHLPNTTRAQYTIVFTLNPMLKTVRQFHKVHKITIRFHKKTVQHELLLSPTFSSVFLFFRKSSWKMLPIICSPNKPDSVLVHQGSFLSAPGILP